MQFCEAATLAVAGAALWMRRKSWRSYTWQQVLTLGVVLGGIGYGLCLPVRECPVNRALYAATGISHLRDFIGHLAILAAAAALICAFAYRLVAAQHMEAFMLRIEVPGALAAVIMLISMLFSHQTKNPAPAPDFFDVPIDGWLFAYWLAYCGAQLYFAGYSIRMLIILRRDERSRLPADLFIAAACVGACVAFTRMVDVATDAVWIPDGAVWTLISTAMTLAALASAVSWRRAAKTRPQQTEPSLWHTR